MSRLTRPVVARAIAVFAAIALVAPIAGVSAQDQGQKVFESKCASCHGKDGKADTKIGKTMKVPDLTKTPWKAGTSQAEVEKLIREGVEKMPKYQGKLEPADITAVAKYSRKLGGLEK